MFWWAYTLHRRKDSRLGLWRKVAGSNREYEIYMTHTEFYKNFIPVETVNKWKHL
jgi:hypothetical protein